MRDGRLRVRSERENPAETLDVRFEEVHQVSALPVTGGRTVDVYGSEEDLRQRILDEPDLVEPGFEPEATERETAAGPVDVFGHDSEGRPVIVELKRRRVGPDAAGQLGRYVDALEREVPDGVEVRGVLVAPSVTDRARELLAEKGLEFVSLEPPGESPTGEESGAADVEEASTPAEGADEDA